MGFQKVVLVVAALALGLFVCGCDDGGEEPTDCTAVAEGLAVCVDDFCNGEGDGTPACECWWTGGDMEPPACTCETVDPVAAFRQACEAGTWLTADCTFVTPTIRQSAEGCP